MKGIHRINRDIQRSQRPFSIRRERIYDNTQ